jgi:hypothetical protein
MKLTVIRQNIEQTYVIGENRHSIYNAWFYGPYPTLHTRHIININKHICDFELCVLNT